MVRMAKGNGLRGRDSALWVGARGGLLAAAGSYLCALTLTICVTFLALGIPEIVDDRAYIDRVRCE